MSFNKFYSAVKSLLLFALIFLVAYWGCLLYQRFFYRIQVLQKIISRLTDETRIAQVVVTQVVKNPLTRQNITTIKFLEFDTKGRPLEPKYYTFMGNLIQFQSLVVRFDDRYVKDGDRLRGKSIYLFWKIFALAGANTQEYIINPALEVPKGYKIEGGRNVFEEAIWNEFWEYALDSQKAAGNGIKNAQIEAPGTRFVPGMIYTIKIEHDGGMRIDANKLPDVLKGEKF